MDIPMIETLSARLNVPFAHALELWTKERERDERNAKRNIKAAEAARLEVAAEREESAAKRSASSDSKKAFFFEGPVEHPTVESFLVKFDSCFFADLPPGFCCDNIYKGSVSVRNSYAYSNPPQSSYLKSVNREDVIIPLNTFRRHMLASLYEVPLRRLEINKSDLSSYLIQSLFSNDEEAFNEFVDKWVQILNKFRIFFYSYCTCKGKNRLIPLDEVTYFQPFFRTYVEGILEYLNLSMLCKNVNSMPLESTIRINTGNNDEERNVSLKGYSDLMIFECDTNLIPQECISFLELKSPMGHLYRSASHAQKDQLLGEAICVTDMKIAHESNNNESTAANNHNAGATIGGLTDMFSLNILLQVWHDKSCYMATHVIEPSEYVMHLLLLCMPMNEDLIAFLVHRAGEEIPVSSEGDGEEKDIEPLPSPFLGCPAIAQSHLYINRCDDDEEVHREKLLRLVDITNIMDAQKSKFPILTAQNLAMIGL